MITIQQPGLSVPYISLPVRPGGIPFPFPQTCRALWLCDEGTGTILFDRSGNQNHCEFAGGGNSPAWKNEGMGLLTGDDYAAAKPIVSRTGLTAGQVVCSITAPYGFIDGTAIGLSVEQIAALKRYVCVLTGTGNAWGFLGSQGAGESLGDKLITSNTGFETHTGSVDDGISDTFTGWNSVNVNDGLGNKIESTATCHGELSAVKIIKTTTGPYIRTGDISVIPGSLIKLSIWTRGDGSNNGSIILYDVTHTSNFLSISTAISGTEYTNFVKYFTVPDECIAIRVILVSSSGAGTVYYDDISLKRVIVSSSNGHISYSSKTNNTISINTNATFNPNAITSLLVYPSSLYFTPSPYGLTIWAVIIPSGATEEGYVISKFDGVLGWSLKWYRTGGTNVLLMVYDGGAYKSSSAVFTENNTPVFIAATVSTSGIVNFWHNKDWAGTGSGTATISDNFAQVYIGARFGSAVASNAFNGTFCCGGILQQTIDKNEIEAIYEYAKASLMPRGIYLS